MSNEKIDGENASSPSSAQYPKIKGKKSEIQLPYLAAAGTIKTAFEKIRQAATPDRVTSDFVTTKLQMKGGNGASIAPFLKKIGLVASDGTPTDLYKQFRNSATGGAAIAAAIKHGYKALADVNEYFYEMNDKELQALIVQVTGTESNSSLSKQIFYTLKALKDYADFSSKLKEKDNAITVSSVDSASRKFLDESNASSSGSVGLNLAYTINLNLPATSDQAVFNAIFKSLKDNLLSNE